MTFRRKILTGTFIAVCVFAFSLTADSAFAANIGKQPMTAVEDVVAATGVDPALKKDSLLYVTYDRSSGKIEFKYSRFGDDYNLETKDKTLFTEQTSFKDYKISGLYPAVSKNYTDSTVPPAIVMSPYLTENNLYQVSKNGDNVSVTGKTAVRTGNHTVSWTGYKDISALTGGIFASGSTREIFAALQWNEHISSSIVNLDLFSVAQGGSEMKWEKVHRVATNHTASSGVTAAKMAVGDFNGDGYANEIAVVTNVPDQWKYYLYVYQVSWKNTAIEVTPLVDAKEVYSHELNTSYNTIRDIWFLKPACDIAMADFNGDGKKEIAVVYKGYNEDLPSGLDSALPNAMGPVYVKLYQYSATRNDRLIESKTAGKKSFDSWTGSIVARIVSSLGDLKAVAADVDGDGKSELVMLGMTWKSSFYWDLVNPNEITMGEWSSQLHIWRHDAPKSGTEITDVPATLNMKYDKQIADFGTFYKSNDKIEVAKLSRFSLGNNVFIGGARAFVTGNTFTEPIFQLTSGVFSGVISSGDKPCEDIIISHSSRMEQSSSYIKAFCPVLDNNGKFKEFKTVDITTGTKSDNITIGLAAGDFVGDGVLLKDQYHFYHDGRSVFTSVIQALPYHVDYIPLP